MENPVIDRTIAAVIIGPIVGLLVMKGLIAPTDANVLTGQIDTVMGGAIALVSIIGFFMHHTAVQNAKNNSKGTTITNPTNIEINKPSTTSSIPALEVTPIQPVQSDVIPVDQPVS